MSEEKDRFSPRIEAIETQWSMIRRAHHGTFVSGNEAKNAMVMRYSAAIRSYIRAMTRNDEEADELSQDVVVRMLKGDFGGADPDRGRFRDLLKVAVRNMVKNHWAKQNRRRTVDFDVEETGDRGTTEESFQDPWLDGWKSNILTNAWDALNAYQDSRSGSVAYTVLKLRAEYPDVDSRELASILSRKTGREFKPDTTRQQLRRARVRFAEFLVEEVAQGLEEATPDRIQDELISLGLYEQIRDVLPEDWTNR